ncbi:MAG: hypothetical protein EOO87_05800 [Pedobacter sp.]|nr:MAG: hypothetical protein EOO87_05800 [Pedobacter sp.]
MYNAGAKLAKYDIFCFMHEDVKIHTNNWGVILHKIFCENAKLGLVGIAGSQYKSLAPSSWHCFEIDAPELMYYQIIQNYKYSVREKSYECSNATNEKLAKVVCVDGVWMCCTRRAYNTYSFDELLLRGFHGYDIDFSLGISQNFQVNVTFEILIEHFSEGNPNKIWLDEIIKVHKKWASVLPVNLSELSQETLVKGEKKAFKNTFKRMWVAGFSLNEVFRLIYQSKRSRVMSTYLFLTLNKHLLKYLVKNRTIS